jgi:exonuclease VII small subunit
MEKFDYGAAVKRLEEIAKTVEDPATGIDDIDKYIKEAGELSERCRRYLRESREKIQQP